MNPTDESQPVIARLNISGREPVDLFGPATIGRDPQSADGQPVEVDGDPLVSKSHFALAFGSDGPTITDLGSSNGTFLHDVDGETAVPTDRAIALPLGAEVEFGDQRLRVELVSNEDGQNSEDGDDSADANATVAHGADQSPVAPIAPADPWGAGIGAESADVVAEAAEASISCSRCERVLPAEAKFCDVCGTPTASSQSDLDWAPSGAEHSDATPQSATAVQRPPLPSEPTAAHVGAPIAAAHVPSDVHAPADVHSAADPRVVNPSHDVPDLGVLPPDVSASGSGSRGGAKKLAIGVGLLLGASAAVFGLSQLFGGDDESAAGRFPTVPESLEERWSESVGDDAIGVAGGADSVYAVLLDGDEVEVSSLAISDGDENWSVGLDPEGNFGRVLGEFDDAVVIEVCGRECELVGLDVSSGDELWAESFADGTAAVIDGRLQVSTDEEVDLIDPASGDSLERVRADFVARVDNYLFALESGRPDEVEVFDADLVSVFGPVEVESDVSAGTFDGTNLIVALEDELQFLNGDGDVVRESRLGVSDIRTISVIGDGNVIIETDDEVLSVDPVDGRADERWSERGRMAGTYRVDGGAVVLIGDDGSDDIDVVDADTGDRRFTVDDVLGDEEFVRPTSNAAVFVRTEFDSPPNETTLRAFDWVTGDEFWDESSSGLFAIGDGVLLELDDRGDVTLYD